MAAVNYFKKLAGSGKMKFVELDGKPGVKEVSETLAKNLK